ncbi:MlaA family lipoprotein [Thiovibrio sp. JS02]
MKLTKHLLQKMLMTVCCALFLSLGSLAAAQEDEASFADEPAFGEEQPMSMASDPLEPVNRVFFHFNDKLYFWVLKPAAQGYAYFLADDVRISVRDFFHNLLTPVRVVNNLLQGKVKDSGIEVARFVINSTLGVAGFGDPAKREFGLAPRDEDLGQTLGVYGMGEGIYICWPVFGPSNVRDTLGLVGDAFLNPLTYLAASDTGAGLAAQAGREVNNTSLTTGDYEDFKESALDPYIALRDAYRQYRLKKIRDAVMGKDSVYSNLPVAREGVYAGRLPERGAGGEATDSAFADPFFVQVGTSVDPDQALLLQQQLLAMGRRAVIKVYDRGDYKYYGVQVPVGAEFSLAKAEEQVLCAAGFSEARLLK